MKTAPVVIFGAGGLGLICMSIIKAMKGKGAIAVDIDPVKREAAKRQGAFATVDPNAPDARTSADLASAADVSPAPAPDTAPPITSAPPAWVRPADCGGSGDTCPNGIFDCSSNSMCQLEGYVCVPLAPKTSDPRPYCMAYSCMSFPKERIEHMLFLSFIFSAVILYRKK